MINQKPFKDSKKEVFIHKNTIIIDYGNTIYPSIFWESFWMACVIIFQQDFVFHPCAPVYRRSQHNE